MTKLFVLWVNLNGGGADYAVGTSATPDGQSDNSVTHPLPTENLLENTWWIASSPWKAKQSSSDLSVQ